MNMSQQCAFMGGQGVKAILGCISESVDSRSYSLSSALLRWHLEYCTKSELPSTQKTLSNWKKASRCILRWLGDCNTAWMRDLGLFSLQKKSLGGASTCCINYLMGSGKKDWARSFPEAQRKRPRGDGHRSQPGKLWSDTSKTSLQGEWSGTGAVTLRGQMTLVNKGSESLSGGKSNSQLLVWRST